MLDKSVKKIIETIKNNNGNSVDIASRELKICNTLVSYMYLESTSSDDKISNFLGKSLSYDAKIKKSNLFQDLFETIKNTIPNSKVKVLEKYDDVFYYLASGFTVLFVENSKKGIAIETRIQLDRGVQESVSEPVAKGPKDSFTENFQKNIGLIRKRIKDENLYFKEHLIGKRSKTKVAISYINDIVDQDKLAMVNKKISEIDIDGILDSTYISELIGGNKKTTFPSIISTERPDLVCNALLEGKIAIIVENTPDTLIIPGLFIDYFRSPDDLYTKPASATFTRILRYVAFLIAILTPAIYIAITTYNTEVVPNTLLISFAIQKEGVPFPTIIEVLILVLAYEILRESDLRKSKTMGASISIVGALILGEASVSAGIISPIVVIVVSLSAIAGMVFADIDMINSIRWWRILFMIAAVLFGLIGIFILGTVLITKLVSIEVLNVPYLAPIAPTTFRDWKNTIFRANQKDIKKRPSYLNTKDKIRLGGKM